MGGVTASACILAASVYCITVYITSSHDTHCAQPPLLVLAQGRQLNLQLSELCPVAAAAAWVSLDHGQMMANTKKINNELI